MGEKFKELYVDRPLTFIVEEQARDSKFYNDVFPSLSKKIFPEPIVKPTIRLRLKWFFGEMFYRLKTARDVLMGKDIDSDYY